MPMPQKHRLVLRQNPNPPLGAGAFELACSCQWAGCAHTLEVAERWVEGHAYSQSSMGHEVIIVRELLDKPSVVDGKQE